MADTTTGFDWSTLCGAGLGNAEGLCEGDSIIIADANGATIGARVVRVTDKDVELTFVAPRADRDCDG